MNLRASQVVIGLVVIIIIAAAAYAVLHKSTQSTVSSSASGPLVQTKSNSSIGSYLADAKGRALYTYGQDTAGVSNCSGSCLANWPAYLATGSTGSLPAHVTTIKRTDGSTQYAYDGKPLYTFVSDSQAGSVTGDGVEGFHIAKPAAAAAQTAPTTATPAPTPAPSAPTSQPSPAPTPTPAPSPAYNY